ncbi:AraC family transcriptional regulator [Sphingobium sp. CAP-1]|uniref:AraC family transcriptional regulator n=1 Tax=Sphingobium sp. CAP-1 TaxID=2676077 RepID=UPI0012BB47B4|nr:AraC family transcriptional regulator [Sphingobium sp. CAP-1]QGP81241.1 helix-turn-helix domain-containing protein [Sphingobium sp. CAP-1]
MTKGLIHSKQLSRPVPGHVSAAIARDLLRLVDEFGDDRHALMRQAGLAHLAPMLLDVGRTGRPLAHEDFIRLYAHCTWVLDAHAARQEGRDPLTKSGLDMLCHCIITCRTLRDAIDRADRFCQLLAPRLSRLVIDEEDGVARLSMPTIRRVRNACAYLSDLTGLSTYHRLFSWLIGEDIVLFGAAMRYPPLLDERTVSHLMPCPVRHGAPENSLRFAAAYLDRPVIRSPFELDHLLIFFPFDMEAPLSKEAPLSERIAHLFSAMLASSETPAPAAQLARQFGISVATLKRRLLAEGTSLARIKGEARLGLACQLLSDPRLTITEVGRRARFSDTGAFRRAFHQWTGLSPSAWRDAHMAATTEAGG